MSLLGMKGALAWNERPVNINEQREWHAGCVNARVKLGHQVDFTSGIKVIILFCSLISCSHLSMREYEERITLCCNVCLTDTPVCVSLRKQSRGLFCCFTCENLSLCAHILCVPVKTVQHRLAEKCVCAHVRRCGVDLESVKVYEHLLIFTVVSTCISK